MTKDQIGNALLASLKELLAKNCPDYAPLAKSLEAKGSAFLHKQPEVAKTLVDGQAHAKMGVLPSAKAGANEFSTEVLNHAAISKPQDMSKMTDRGVQSKAIFKAPSGARYMAKPYSDKLFPLGGWAENTSQGLYHAAGVGHLHQKSHIAEVKAPGPEGKSSLATVIHMDPNMETSVDRDFERKGFPKKGAHADLHKIAALDFLTNNTDRHAGNLMSTEDGKKVLAIDNGGSFLYSDDLPYRHGSNHAMELTEQEHPFTPEVRDWWSKASGPVRQEFQKHLGLIKDPKLKQRIAGGFERNASVLDRYSADKSVPYHELDPDFASGNPTAKASR